MTPVALLNPAAPESSVEPFRKSTPDLKVIGDLREVEAADAALIFGGDGTVHRHLPELYRRKIPVLVVPKGSGNDFAKALGIRNEQTALRAWEDFCRSAGRNVREIDLGVVRSAQEEILFCCVAGAGLDSAANVLANRMPRWLRGTAGYLVAAVSSLITFEPADFVLTTESLEIRRKGFFVAAGNAHRYGRGMRVAPQAELDDGLLDICLVGAMNKVKLLFCIPAVFTGSHLRVKQVEYFRAGSLRIETERPLEVYADGEFACTTPVEIGVSPHAFRVIVPA